MFTGLVQEVGSVLRVVPGPSTELWIQTGFGNLTRGESIAVNGVCVTVVQTHADGFSAELSPETLRRSNLGSLRRGDEVNLERAMALSDRLGGHLVLGHVDATTELLERSWEGGSVVMTFLLPTSLAPFFIEKGSVTVDGVSLTVNQLTESRFTVALIPETQSRTTLGKKAPGARVNVEADVIGKYVARWVSPFRPVDEGER